MRWLDPPIMVIIGTALALASCAPTEEGASEAETEQAGAESGMGLDRQAAEALVEDFDRAANAEDVDALMAIFVDDPVSLPPNVPPATGRDAVRDYWASFFAQGDLQVDNVLVDLHTSGDLAVARGSYELTITPAEGEPIQDAGKWVAWWRRGADGTWKALGNAWSSNNPPPGQSG